MRRKGVRFPIFWKILGACLALAGLMIVGSYLFAKYEALKTPARGNFLQQHYNRFKAHQETLAQATASVGEVIADDLAARMAPAPGAPGDAATRAAELYALANGRRAIRPDLFAVFDAAGQPLFLPEGSPLEPKDLRDIRMAATVRGGTAVWNKLLVHEDQVFVVTGIPIQRKGDGGVAGGLLLGTLLERQFEDYRRLSSDNEARQVRLSLFRDGRVLTSAFPRERWEELASAVKPERRGTAEDGSTRIPVLLMDGKDWDFHETKVRVEDQAEDREYPVYLIRSRADVQKPATFTFAVLSALGFAFIVAALLALWITRPVKQFIRATREIAMGEGDLTKRIDIDANDELGDLADNLNRLFGNLETLAREVQNASLQVGASSAEISAASRQMLDGAKDQAMKIEGSTAAVTELSSSIQQVASNAIEATKVAHQSNEQVSSAIQSMNHIRETVEDAAERIRELGESGKRIGNIVEVIRQISEQTSLLALNASIEAAHAGEQGRGFAVVADEVSSLARRVGQSAKDIEDLIATIKDQTASAVTTMQAGTADVERGTVQVTSTLGNLKQIIDVVQDTANAVQEQAIVSDEIARNMDAVQKIAHEVVGSSEEAVIQGEQLHALAHTLEQSVRGFNLDGDGARPFAAAIHEPAPGEAPRLSPPREPAANDPAAQRAAAGGRAAARPPVRHARK